LNGRTITAETISSPTHTKGEYSQNIVVDKDIV
jgi:hypothetical protein